ncbi:MAG: aminoacetone oxidase family FAD-binding enzyme [Clostridia bacterium]|nr:aminoacetone oxidase family FAD-binding enzyme [Clostridia bacterium]
MNQKVLSVIGGGASGLAAAIEAARFSKAKNSNIKIIIYERLPKVGKKILATGNGRCNIMNTSVNKKYYHGDSKLLSSIFENFTIENNIEFFRSMGIYLAEEDDGRLYPLSFQASSVLDALRFEAENLGIEIKCDTKIEKIKRNNNVFILNENIYSDAVIIAGGGKSASVQGSDGSCFDLLSSLGIKIRPTFPSLTGIVLKNKNKALKGVRAAGEIYIVENGTVVASSEGELQYTDYGISGIPAMEVSRAVSEHFALHKKGKIIMAVNSLPDFTPEEIFDYIITRKKQNPNLLCEDLLSGVMPKKLGMAKLSSASISCTARLSTLTKNKIAFLTEIINSEIFEISGALGFDNSQVTAGGADTKLFNQTTLEAKNINGLFACGEVLDIDAVCGGFNLSWAWSSGRCAGTNAIKYLSEK